MPASTNTSSTVESLAQQREELKREFAALAVNDALWRQTARIEAFQEQAPWIAQLQAEIDELEKEIGGLSSELAAECQRLGLSDPDCGAGVPPALCSRDGCTTNLPALSRRSFPSFVRPANCCGRAAGDWRKRSKRRPPPPSRPSRSRGKSNRRWPRAADSDLAAALDQAGNLVSQFRRRLQIDDRLDQLARHQTELEEQEPAVGRPPTAADGRDRRRWAPCSSAASCCSSPGC